MPKKSIAHEFPSPSMDDKRIFGACSYATIEADIFIWQEIDKKIHGNGPLVWFIGGGNTRLRPDHSPVNILTRLMTEGS